MDREPMDIYLVEGAKSQPDLSTLASWLGAAALGVAVRSSERRPGFLYLDLHENDARTLLASLQRAGARGSVVKARYRGPAGLPMQDALAIADRELTALQRRHHRQVEFNDTRFVREEALWWVFCRPSQALIDQGVVPGALYASIDKLDGHLWSEAEQADFFQVS